MVKKGIISFDESCLETKKKNLLVEWCIRLLVYEFFYGHNLTSHNSFTKKKREMLV